MKAFPTRYLIFSDLDGTLLDEQTYSWEAARPALEIIRRRNIPLIFTTSKTLAEAARLQKEMDIVHPVIFENGAGVAVPEGYFRRSVGARQWDGYEVHVFGPHYHEICQALRQLRREKRYPFRGFEDMSVAAVARCTGLSRSAARLAKDRRCSEPILWQGSPQQLEEFGRELKARGLKLLQGGRFWHVLGDEADKGVAARWLLKRYQEEFPQYWRTIGIGDSPNDLELLRTVEVPILVQRSDGSYLPVDGVGNILPAPGKGPAGWNRILLRLLRGETP